MILTLGHTKGGVGKSTLALNIAIERLLAGVDTLLVDGDPKQTSISKAIGIRAEAVSAPGCAAQAAAHPAQIAPAC